LITLGIIALTVVLSLFCFSNRESFDRLTLAPHLIRQNKSQAYRLVSHAFIHADTGHLLFNMLTLFFFGSEVEKGILSPAEFIVFYLMAILFSSLPSYQKNKANPQYIAVGASGAVSAIMFVMVLFQPWSVIYLKFIIPIYFILFAFGYLAYSYYQGKKGNSNIGHDAHLYGALFGLAYMLVVHPGSLRLFLDRIVEVPFLK
jgi:membrane associated rhomboid family serine protease